MKNKKETIRTCVVTREKLNKKDLIRIVKNKENEVFLDLTGKKNGRGVYLKKDLEVITKAKEKKIIDKMLEINVPNEVYEEIFTILN